LGKGNEEMKKKTAVMLFCGAVLIYSLIVICLSWSEIREGLAIGRGEELLAKGQYEQALTVFTILIDSNPDSEKLYYNRAMAYLGLKQYERAISECEIGMGKSNSITSYYNYLNLQAIIYTQIGDYQRAGEICAKAISAVPHFAQAYSIRASVYFYQRDYYHALKDCEKAIQLDSSNTLAYKVKGWIHAKAGEIDKGELEKAIENFNRVIKLDPEDVNTYYNRGMAFYKEGKKEQAIADFNRVISIGTEPELSQKSRELLALIEKEN